MDCVQLASDLTNVINSAYETLCRLSEEEVQQRPAQDQWSIKEIIGHLVDSASNNHQRWVRLQIGGDLSFPDYRHDNDQWVRIQNYHHQDWGHLLQLWRYFNLHLATVITGVESDCLENKWVVDGNTRISLGDLMTDYLAHLKIHLEQIGTNLSGAR